MNKFISVIEKYRKPVSLTIAGLNLLSGLHLLMEKQYTSAALSFFVAFVLVIDTMLEKR